jgi:hypothetical protein
MAKKPTVRFVPEPDEYDPIPHYHVMVNDVGYMPDVENIGTYLHLDDAIEDMLERVDEHLEALSQSEDPETRGGTLIVDEVASIEQQLVDYREAAAKPDHKKLLATYGYWFGLDGGIAVVELSTCVENCLSEE